LVLKGVQVADSSILTACIPPGAEVSLRSLNITPKGGQIVDFLATRGYIPSLIELHLTHWRTRETGTLSFLRANTQLQIFTASSSILPSFLEAQLLPDLASSFRSLTTLALTWDDTEISELSLQTIGSIVALKKLWISAGEQFGWRHNWEIDHKTLLRAFKPLLNLEYLAFSRDSYMLDASLRLGNGTPMFRVDEYYNTFVLPGYGRYEMYLHSDEVDRMEVANEQERTELQQVAWERWHRKKIVGIANQYVDTLPNLDWLYFGQLPMKVVMRVKQRKSGKRKNTQGTEKRRIVVVESDRRDDCWTHLRRVWGILA
jgi:hypothetical protein